MITRMILLAFRRKGPPRPNGCGRRLRPLMIEQPGCKTEQLPWPENLGEFISLSTWETRKPSIDIAQRRA
jgi:hypothetical protein